MRKIVIFLSIVVAAATGLMVVGCSERAEPTPDPEQIQAERVKRGQYLVTIGGCHDCHTPHKMGPKGLEPDMTRALSGHPQDLVMPSPPDMGGGPWVWAGAGTNTAFAGPWGVSFARNLTPETLTGTGIWTEETFTQTLRSGMHWGVSRPILPPMPWQNYGQATDEDLKSIFAYLRTLKPIKNQVPDAVLAPPPSKVASAAAAQ